MRARSHPSMPTGDIGLSCKSSKTQRSVLQFVRRQLPDFVDWFFQSDNVPELEDEISKELLRFFNQKAKSTNLLFHFDAKKGADFQIWVHLLQGEPPVFLVEAKRLPPTNTRDYVHHPNKPGGIGRFKQEQKGFGSHLSICAMLGYVQEKSFGHWHGKVNSWIEELIESNDASDIIWADEDKLVEKNASELMAEYESEHSRITKNKIKLYHFWLDMKGK